MIIPLTSIQAAAQRLQGIVEPTPLQYSERLSELYGARIYLKREDLTRVRSFKLRGAYNKVKKIREKSDKNSSVPIVCASAGNHAQGVAYACAQLQVHGIIYMPIATPNQKVEKVKHFGGSYIEIKLYGHSFDEAKVESMRHCERVHGVYVHPFDDEDVIAGQGTVALEIDNQYQNIKISNTKIDSIICCVGGGGLISGVSSYFRQTSSDTRVIGSEPEGADCMYQGLIAGHPVTLERFDTFVDGAAVRTVGETTLAVARECVSEVVVAPVGLVCTTMIDLYQSEGIITEPAGALAVAALELKRSEIAGKTVVCIISGGNNDILRYPEIQEKSLIYRGLKHYFILEFAQKPGQLKAFLNHALGPSDDIVLFEYLKRTNKEKGPAMVGIELKSRDDLAPLIANMDALGLTYKKITSDDLAFNLLI